MKTICPCGSQKAYELCCGHYHQHYDAPTALALMRSRYSAFCMGNFHYIEKTMQGKASLGFNLKETEAWAKSVYWLGLEIIEASEAHVEFIASYMSKDTLQFIHERSEFKRIEEKWYYIDGVRPQNKHSPKTIKIAKNAPCPCKSLRKFKNCHGSIKSN